MAGGFLGKTLAAVSLSVALASVTIKSLGGCSVAACRNSLSSCRFHVNSNMMSGFNGTKEKFHNKARTSPYPGSKVQRSQVPNDKVGWLVEWHDYNPVEYTAVSVLAGPRWADPQINESNFSPKFNEKDGQVERKSQNGLYEVENGRPRNPVGRTGLVGRGLLGRWGPNHAADPIITKWKRDRSGNKITHPISGKNILQFVAIKRKDCGEWAIPGGMVDPGEKISATLKREFGEEALNSLQKSSAEKRELQEKLHKLFSQDHLVIYKGYVDDPRNTDNAWMETEAVNYHDETGEIMDNLTLEAGDDAGKVKWMDISDKLKLYASHAQFIKRVAEKRDAHWSEDFETGCPGYEGYFYHIKRLSEEECRSPLPNLDLSLNYLVHTLLYMILLKLVSKMETFCILDFRVVSYMRKFQSLFWSKKIKICEQEIMSSIPKILNYKNVSRKLVI